MENFKLLLIGALLKAQTEIDHAVKDAKNPYFKNDYATLEQVINTVKKPLNDNGIYFQQRSALNEHGAVCETVFFGHSSELSAGDVFVPADKHDPQAFGSALTYARRYSLSMACGISSKDDDAEGAMQRDKIKPTKYKMVGKDGKQVVASDTEEDFLKHLQRLLKDPENSLFKTLYKKNKETIQKAHDASEGKTQESYAKCISMYETDDKKA